VKNVTQSLIGHPLSPDDETWRQELARVFVDGGFRMKPLVRAIVTSPRYRANDGEAR
jgi:hypothetical protein